MTPGAPPARGRGRIARRLALALVATALIPVVAAIVLADAMVRQATDRYYLPEVGERLEQSLGLYQELARATKAVMRAETSALAARPELRRAAAAEDAIAVERELRGAFAGVGGLVSLTVLDASGDRLAQVDRGRPIDPDVEHELDVERALGAEGAPGPRLVAVFAADRRRFAELESVNELVTSYAEVERRRDADRGSYLTAFAALLGFSIVAAVAVGTLLARSVSSRLGRFAAATHRAAGGDLAVRVSEAGRDEIADLGRAFNLMLGEIETSRARIEYLQRIGAWQEMARRLAHEIKNPLTPIQLAVQEAHRRYPGEDDAYLRLLDTTLEIVEDEVGTLRRLVGEFSDFARLPRARLERGDLAGFLRAQHARWTQLEEAEPEGEPLAAEHRVARNRAVRQELEVPSSPVPADFDAQMLRRALVNLIENAQQAIEGAGRPAGVVRVSLRVAGKTLELCVDDDGPGFPPDLGESVFDPYVTRRDEGTGLGLAIVKKIVVEHGGRIHTARSPLGGARVALELPRP
ncbi:MAG: HAMP domain-containing protein [Polyangiaceae bacterium]|nr:HAMP domain-containing protein [Polyangiaceae bacterium]